jgi:hypothetical protein
MYFSYVRSRNVFLTLTYLKQHAATAAVLLFYVTRIRNEYKPQVSEP